MNQREVVRVGKQIYERHRARLEASARGHFTVVDVSTGQLLTAPSAEEASQKARAAGAAGPFYLARIGARVAYRSRRTSHGADPRLLR